MTIPANIEAIALGVLERFGLDLVLGTFRRERPGRVLRLFIERKDADPAVGSGVDLGLCAAVSRDIGAALDAEDAVSEAYTLEVSSPGIERPLVKPEDFVRFAGRQAAVRTNTKVAGRRRVNGRLEGYRGGVIVISTPEGEQMAIPMDQVERANLVFEPKGSSR